VNNDFSKNMFDRDSTPGWGSPAPGYKESDLVDYGTTTSSWAARCIEPDHLRRSVTAVEVVLASNYSTGSTVYQGDNRYRLEDVQFFQHKVEVKEEGKWFVRGYVTHEDAGNTYDIFTTALRMQEAGGSTKDWNTKYFTLWETWIKPQINQIDPGFITVQEAPGQGITHRRGLR
jgi:iron complex outermembrane receptor protein